METTFSFGKMQIRTDKTEQCCQHNQNENI